MADNCCQSGMALAVVLLAAATATVASAASHTQDENGLPQQHAASTWTPYQPSCVQHARGSMPRFTCAWRPCPAHGASGARHTTFEAPVVSSRQLGSCPDVGKVTIAGCAPISNACSGAPPGYCRRKRCSRSTCSQHFHAKIQATYGHQHTIASHCNAPATMSRLAGCLKRGLSRSCAYLGWL